MPYLGWGGCGLGSGVTSGFRASTVPGIGTTAPVTAESLAKSRMQRLCPDGVLKMNRNGKSSFCHTAKSYFSPGRTVCIKRWENSELMRALGCWDKRNLPWFCGTFRFFPFIFQFYLFPHHFHEANISVYSSCRQQLLFFYLFFYFFLLPDVLAHWSVPKHSDSSNAEHNKV